MPPELLAVWDFIANGGGALGLAIFLIFAFMRGWIVPGEIYTSSQKRIERLIDVTEANAASMDRLSDSLTKSVDRLTDEFRSDRRAR